MVKKRVKASIIQRDIRGEESISLVHNEIPSHLWSQISKYNPQVAAFASFLRGDVPDVASFPSLEPNEYLILRNLAIEKGWLDAQPSQIKEEKSTKLKAADRIRIENMKRLFNRKLDSFLKSENLYPTSALDFRVMALMRFAHKLLENPSANEKELYAIALSLLKMPISRTSMNPLLRDDLILFRRQFLEAMEFDIMYALETYPDFALNPPYLDILPLRVSYSLRPNQEKMIDALQSDSPVLVINRGSLNSGKTVAAVKAAVNLHSQGSEKTILFCCVSLAIRVNVAQMAAATQVPFALYQKGSFLYPPYIAQTLGTEKKTFVNLVIVNYEDVKQLLETEYGKFALVLDEPTIGADQPNDPRIHSMVDILLNLAPDQTVLVSGTLPAYDDFREFYDRIRVKAEHPDTPVIEIADTGSALGCDLIRPDKTYYVPENIASVPNVSKAEDILVQVLDELTENPLLTRFHNFRRFFSLLDFIENDDRIDEYDELDRAFMNPKNWTHEAFAKAVRVYLTNLLKYPETIPDACKPEPVPESQQLNFDRILTSEAHRLFGGCLVVSSDPLNTAFDYATPLVSRYGRMEAAKYKEEPEAFDEYGWELLEREVVKEPVVEQDVLVLQERVKASESDLERGGSSRSFRHGKVADVEVEMTITWGFPKFLQINSAEHQQVYNPRRVISRKDYISPVTFEDLPTSSAINADLLVLLAMGIGVYDESLPNSYLDAVINLATQGKISFLFSNLDISYGVTIPLNRLIINDDDIVDSASTSTMIQLLGRIGRLGRMALIYTRGNNLEEKFNQVLRGEEDYTERDNILKAMEKFQNV